MKRLIYRISHFLIILTFAEIYGQKNPLSDAIEQGNYEKAMEFTNKLSSLNQASGKLGWTPIFYSIFQAGISPSQFTALKKKNKYLQNTELITHQNKFNDLCISLIKNGAHINLFDKKGRSPLYYAVVLRLDTLVSFMIAQKLHIEDSEDLFKLASAHGYPAIVSYLMKVKLNPCESDRDCFAPIHLASINGHLSCIKSIIFHKLDVDCQSKLNYGDFSSLSSLQLAIMNGNNHLIEPLFLAGAKINQLNSRQENLMHLAAKGSRSEIFKVDKKGEPEEYLMVKGGNLACIKLLDSISKEFHNYDAIGANPLHWAAYYRRIDAIVSLIKMGEKPVRINLDAEHAFGSMLSQLVYHGVSESILTDQNRQNLVEQLQIAEKMFSDSARGISHKIVNRKILQAGIVALAVAAASYQASIDAKSTGFGYSSVDYPTIESSDLNSINIYLKKQISICQKLKPFIESLNQNKISKSEFMSKLSQYLNNN